jgi:hypothetical protein
MRRGLILATMLICLLAACPPAMASFASVSGGRLTVTGGSAEVNDLMITSQGGGGDDGGGSSIRVRETGPGADLSHGTGCHAVADNEVRCSSVDRITVNAGDGDDKVVNQTWEPSTLNGGRGADDLSGGGADDTIDGQEENDTLLGGFGDDDMRGGSGVDTVSYSYAWYRIVADLDGNADDGAMGGHDRVGADVENLTGGKSSDSLTGGSGPNVLNGADGNDTLLGGEGGDALVGGAGRDSLSGETGDDSLNSVDGVLDNVACGEGGDTVTADEVDELTPDCESATLSTEVAPPPPGPALVRLQQKPVRVTENGLAPLRLRCTRVARGACVGNLTLTLPVKAKTKTKTKAKTSAARQRARQEVLGRARFRIGSGRLTTVKVRLSRNGRRRVLRRRRVRCRVSVAVRHADGPARTVQGVVTLEGPEVTPP